MSWFLTRRCCFQGQREIWKTVERSLGWMGLKKRFFTVLPVLQKEQRGQLYTVTKIHPGKMEESEAIFPATQPRPFSLARFDRRSGWEQNGALKGHKRTNSRANAPIIAHETTKGRGELPRETRTDDAGSRLGRAGPIRGRGAQQGVDLPAPLFCRLRRCTIEWQRHRPTGTWAWIIEEERRRKEPNFGWRWRGAEDCPETARAGAGRMEQKTTG